MFKTKDQDKSARRANQEKGGKMKDHRQYRVTIRDSGSRLDCKPERRYTPATQSAHLSKQKIGDTINLDELRD